MFELIVAIVVCLYATQVIIYLLASYKRFNRLADDQLPTASVMVAVRDEEKVISRCLDALDKLVYPSGKLQIIVINDSSTDATSEIIRKFILGKPQFTFIDGVEPTGHLRGKTNALVQGLKVATGEIILTTDADCKVNPLWAKTLASYFTDGVGLLGGDDLTGNRIGLERDAASRFYVSPWSRIRDDKRRLAIKCNWKQYGIFTKSL